MRASGRIFNGEQLPFPPPWFLRRRCCTRKVERPNTREQQADLVSHRLHPYRRSTETDATRRIYVRTYVCA